MSCGAGLPQAEGGKEVSEQPTPRTDAKFDLRNEMREAQEFVNSSPLFHRFIDGTPLENDVACWIANAVIEKKDFVRGLERELAEAKEIITWLRNDQDSLLATRQELTKERDQWREVAEELMGAVLEQETPSSVARIGKATLAILDLKEASK